MKHALACSVLFAVTLLIHGTAHSQDQTDAQRIDRGLQVLYDFTGDGDTVRDRSQAGTPLHLKIEKVADVRRSPGSLTIRGNTIIRSDQAPRRLTAALQRTGEATIELWISSAAVDQKGPARILTLSKDTVGRNFTIGQEGDRYDARFRTSQTDANGMPSTASRPGAVRSQPTHLVYTRERSGATRLYVNGKESGQGQAKGNLDNWDASFQLALANELTKDRPWLGTYHFVAIFDRAHTAQEVQQNFRAGFSRLDTTAVAVSKPRPTSTAPPSQSTDQARVSSGLQALYQFQETEGNVVRDSAGVGKPLHLRVTDLKSIRRRNGALEMIGKGTQIRMEEPAARLNEAIKRSGEVTIEAWLRPANTRQDGPARIVTISKDSSNRNVTLGQDGDRFDVRLRTTGTSGNGIPSTPAPSKSIKTELTHVVYTRDRSGRTTIYLNGRSVQQGNAIGNTSNWDSSYRLALGDEFSGGRSWLGTYHLVAIYNRDLSAIEIEQNFKAGPDGSNVQAIAELKRDQRAESFISKVAPLISHHCLECHDTASREGGFDLSRKVSALAGGDSGQAIQPGKPADSLLWQAVEHDKMPHNRPSLSAPEKEVLYNWIKEGAVWPLDFIDQAVYAHGGAASAVWIQRLTVPEYIRTVRDSVGVDIASEARELLPPDMRADGFNNTAYNLNVDLAHIDAYGKLANIIVNRMNVVEFAGQFEKKRRLIDDDMRGLVAKMGHWILRGPLEEHEVVLYRGISTTVASAGGDYEEAVRLIIQAMLQSPRFIYRIESQRGDGTAWPIGQHELAARMSYIVWGSRPDKELLNAADKGDLDGPAAIAQQLNRMLKDQRTVEQSLEFVSEWLNLNRLQNLQPSPQHFPAWKPAIASDMRDETAAFFEEVVWKQRRPLADLLSAQVTFLTPQLAKHYGIKPIGDGLRRYDLKPADRRGGLLTQGSVLTVGGDEASMVTRGLLVLHELLRGVVKDPPPCVDTTPVPTEPGITQRTLAESRIANQACGGCHAKFEPLAFGLEKFDGLGSFHEVDQHGNRLREDGEVLIPGEAKPKKYQTSAELMQLLATSPRVQESLTWKLTQFALGRPLTARDAPIVKQIHTTAQQQGGTYTAILSAIVMSDLVQKTRTEPQ